jgi:DNA-binding transcriptional ArsR family regulator
MTLIETKNAEGVREFNVLRAMACILINFARAAGASPVLRQLPTLLSGRSDACLRLAHCNTMRPNREWKALDRWKPFGYGIGNHMVALTSKQRDAVFRAIADPTRRGLLSLLRSGQRSVGDIAGNFRMSRPAVSKHLRVLRSAGLVVARQAGASSLCGLKADPLRAVDDWLQDYQTFWSESMQSLKKHVEEEQ